MADELQTLEANSNAAHTKMFEALRRRFPEGARVEVYLSGKQKVPSEAEVVWWTASRYAVRVRLVKEKRYGGHHVADVHWTKCNLI